MNTEKIKELVLKYFEPPVWYSELHGKLKAYGRDAVEPVLDVLEEQHAQRTLENDYTSLLYLVDLATDFAEEKHADRLAQTLLWDEICLSTEESVRGSLLNVLSVIGTTSIIPTLEESAKRVKKAPYQTKYAVHDRNEEFGILDWIPREYYQEKDQEKVKETIAAIRKRVG